MYVYIDVSMTCSRTAFEYHKISKLFQIWKRNYFCDHQRQQMVINFFSTKKCLSIRCNSEKFLFTWPHVANFLANIKFSNAWLVKQWRVNNGVHFLSYSHKIPSVNLLCHPHWHTWTSPAQRRNSTHIELLKVSLGISFPFLCSLAIFVSFKCFLLRNEESKRLNRT